MTESRGLHLLTGPRLVEMIVIAVVSSVMSGAFVAWASVQVLQNEVQGLRASQEELKKDIRDLRRDLYAPRGWDGPHGGSVMPEQYSDLIVDLKASLHSAAQYFHGVEGDPDADYQRHLRIAETDLARYQGRVLVGAIEIKPGQSEYTDLPDDLVDVRLPIWGTRQHIETWSPAYPGRLPRLRLRHTAEGPALALVPAPTLEQIRVLGSEYSFYYTAGFAIEGGLVLTEEQRSLLLLRAQAEAMRELAMQNMVRPVETRTSVAMPRNMTPRAMYEAFLAEFHRRVGREVAA